MPTRYLAQMTDGRVSLISSQTRYRKLRNDVHESGTKLRHAVNIEHVKAMKTLDSSYSALIEWMCEFAQRVCGLWDTALVIRGYTVLMDMTQQRSVRMKTIGLIGGTSWESTVTY